MSACNCIKKLNEVLAQKNARISLGLQITKDLGLQSRVLVATEKIDAKNRKALPPVAASYCPFCGVKLWSDS